MDTSRFIASAKHVQDWLYEQSIKEDCNMPSIMDNTYTDILSKALMAAYYAGKIDGMLLAQAKAGDSDY